MYNNENALLPCHNGGNVIGLTGSPHLGHLRFAFGVASLSMNSLFAARRWGGIALSGMGLLSQILIRLPCRSVGTVTCVGLPVDRIDDTCDVPSLS